MGWQVPKKWQNILPPIGKALQKNLAHRYHHSCCTTSNFCKKNNALPMREHYSLKTAIELCVEPGKWPNFSIFTYILGGAIFIKLAKKLVSYVFSGFSRRRRTWSSSIINHQKDWKKKKSQKNKTTMLLRANKAPTRAINHSWNWMVRQVREPNQNNNRPFW